LIKLSQDGSQKSCWEFVVVPILLWHLLHLEDCVNKIVSKHVGELIQGVSGSSHLLGGNKAQKLLGGGALTNVNGFVNSVALGSVVNMLSVTGDRRET